MKLLDTLIEERAEVAETQHELVTRAADESRDLTETEDQNLKDLQERASELDVRIAELREIKESNMEAARMKAEVAAMGDTTEERAAVGQVVVTDEPLTYRQHGEHNFFQDMYRAQVLSDPAAQARQTRHMQEMEIEYRDSSSSNFAGLVVPQYLVNEAAALARAGSPVLQNSRRLNLPADGLTVNISRITTGTSIAAQSAENAALTESSPDDTLLTVNVNSYGGFADISRQAIDRGSGVDSIIIADMALAYATAVDADVINGSGSSGTHLGILNVSGINDVDEDDASPTAAETFQAIIKGISEVNSNYYLPPDVIFMHPRRWAYISGGLDGNSRPLVNPQGNNPTDPVAVGSAAGYGSVVGNIAGVDVVTDANIPTNLGAGTNEDRVIITRRDNLLYWSDGNDAPTIVRYDSVGANSLTIRMVAFGYSAFTAGRYPAAVTACQGTLFAATL